MLSLAHMPMPHFVLADAIMSDVACALNRGSRLSCEQPSVDETDDAYTITVSAPGVKSGDITIEALENPTRLTVKGESTVGGGSHTHFVNYSVGLPRDANVDIASAENSDGLVIVTVPKKPKAEPGRIAVNTKEDDSPCGDECPCHDDNMCGSTSKPYNLTVVAPGLAAADLSLNVEEGPDLSLNLLVVTGATAKTGASIDRRYRLPRDADVEKATAAHVDGVLTITLPKKAAPKPKSIAIAGIQKAAEDDKDEDGVMV